MNPRPLLLGLLWLMCLVCSGQTQDNDHETHQVYSYTYHFQHNGTTDPKKLVQSLLAKPPNPRGAEVKTFWNPDVRGFVSQGFFPIQPPTTRFNNQVKPPTFEGIKKIVDENLKQVPNPIPPELIKVPPHVENTIRNIDDTVNRRLSNLNRLDNLDLGPRGIQGPGGGILNAGRHQHTPQTHVNNGVVTNVRTFEKDLPNGKIFEKIETFSYNPAPVSNSIEGPHQNQQVFNHNQRAFGRAVSYFRKEHRTEVPPVNQISGDFPSNNARNIHQNLLHGNLNNRDFNNNNNFNHNNNDHTLNNLVRNLNEVRNNLNNGFGARITNFPNHNKPFSNHQNNPSVGNHNVINQNRHNNRNFHNTDTVNSVHNRNLQNLDRQNQIHNRNVHHNQPNQNINRVFHQNVNQNNRNLHNRIVQNVRQHVSNGNRNDFGRGNNNNPAHNVLNTLNQYSRNNEDRHPNPIQEHRPNINPFKWDDDNRGWRADHNMDWSRRNVFNPEANQVFTNEGANHGQQNNGHHNNPVDALRSTLEALTGRTFQIPNLNGNGGEDGNYNNFRGGGEERTFSIDRVAEGPNSYQRNQLRRYDRNFSVDTNSGYQFSKRWSTGDLSRLSTTRNARSPTFKKDFIDVFADED